MIHLVKKDLPPSPRLSTTKSLEKMHISGAPGYDQASCPHTTKLEQLIRLHRKWKTQYNHSIKLLAVFPKVEYM